MSIQVLHVVTPRGELPSSLIDSVLRSGSGDTLSYRYPTRTDAAVIQHVVEAYSAPGDTVYDPMCGTGGFVKGAIQSGRSGYGSDIVHDFVALGNADILAECGLEDRLRVISAFDLPSSQWVQDISPIKLAFFSPPLTRSYGMAYSAGSDQLGNLEYGQLHLWIDGVLRIVEIMAELIAPGGAVVVNSRNQLAGGVLLPNVHLLATRALDSGFSIISETVVVFDSDHRRMPEFVLALRRE